MVSKNISKEQVREFSEVLGVKQASSLGVYLEMPSQIGRNKNREFSKILDKVDKVLQG